MGLINRVLPAEPIPSFDDYLESGGGRGLAVAAKLQPEEVTALVEASGLRGRGGAGFPTGVKWRTVLGSAAEGEPITVVVNAAEGEPGTFKDRELLRRDPYRVLEGALVAAFAMGAPTVVVAAKASFRREIQRIREAVADLREAQVARDVAVEVVEGPSEYLFGEETALLEVIDGRHPFPRTAPPFRRGLDPHPHAPVLVDNVETLANVPGIVAEGAEWFRSAGTDASPGTLICTVSGDTSHHGVAEFEMGTALSEVVEVVGRGPAVTGRRWIAAATGTANPIVTSDQFDTPLTYESMSGIGSALGTGGLIVFDDSRGLPDIARAISHFLAIESCGQCEPCKLDGQTIAAYLRDLSLGQAEDATVDSLRRKVGSVAAGARCALARQQEAVVGDVLARCGGEIRAAVEGTQRAVTSPVVIAPIVDLVDGRFQLDETFATKQPDWTHHENDSAMTPVERLSDSSPLPVTTVGSPAQEGGETGEPEHRDPFEPLIDLHASMRHDLDALMFESGSHRRRAVESLARHIDEHTEVTDRIVYPMLRRAGALGDDAIWSAQIHALGALDMSRQLGEIDDAEAVDRLATDLRRVLRANELVVFPLLNACLDADELTDLADAIDEVLVGT